MREPTEIRATTLLTDINSKFLLDNWVNSEEQANIRKILLVKQDKLAKYKQRFFDVMRESTNRNVFLKAIKYNDIFHEIELTSRQDKGVFLEDFSFETFNELNETENLKDLDQTCFPPDAVVLFFRKLDKVQA